MTQRVNYDEHHVYAPSENDKHMSELVFQEDGKIDFHHAPEGFVFDCFRISDDKVEAYSCNFDPRFIIKRRISGTTTYVFYFLRKIDAPNYLNLYRKGYASKEDFRKHCVSLDARNKKMDSRTGEEIEVETPSDYNLENDVLDKDQQKRNREILRKRDEKNAVFNQAHPTACPHSARHEEIYVRYFLDHERVTDICTDLNMSKSTVSGIIDRCVKYVKTEYTS